MVIAPLYQGCLPLGKSNNSHSNSNSPLSGSLAASDLGANDLNKLSRMAYTIYAHQQRGDLPIGWQEAVQSISYTLLTLYSNQPRNCLALESAYHYLTILLLALPALALGDGNENSGDKNDSGGRGSFPEALTAVLTTLDYVCNCAGEATVLPLAALTAATGVISKLLLLTPAGAGARGESHAVQVPPTPGSAFLPHTGSNYSEDGSQGPALHSPLYPMGYSPHMSNPSLKDARTIAPVGSGRPSVRPMFDPGPGMTFKHLGGLLHVLPQIIDSFDNISRLKSIYNQHLLRSGLLTHLHCTVFENLYLSLGTSSDDALSPMIEGCDGVVPMHHVQTYTNIIDLLLVLHINASNNDIATEARQTGLTVLMRNLMRHSKVGIELTKQLLLVPECLACPVNHNHPVSAIEDMAVNGSSTHLEEGIQSLLDVIRQVRFGHPRKVTVLLRSIRTMLLQSGRGKGGGNLAAGAVWRRFGGYNELLDTISGYRHCFVHDQEQKQMRLQVLECLRVAFEIIVCDMALHRRACGATPIPVPSTVAMIKSYDDEGGGENALQLAGLAEALRTCGIFATFSSTATGGGSTFSLVEGNGGEFGQDSRALMLYSLDSRRRSISLCSSLEINSTPHYALLGLLSTPMLPWCF